MSLGSEITEEYYETKVLPKMKNLIAAQKEYIEFLSKEVSRLSEFIPSHPHLAASEEIIQKGRELRAEIEKYT